LRPNIISKALKRNGNLVLTRVQEFLISNYDEATLVLERINREIQRAQSQITAAQEVLTNLQAEKTELEKFIATLAPPPANP